MRELKLGKISSKELANWFGIAYSTFRNTKAKRLKELEDYCDFELIHGKIEIKEIYFPKYDKGYTKDDEVYLREVKASNEYISSIAGIARKLKNFDEDYSDLSVRQIERRMCKAGVRTFGVTSSIEYGEYGSREYVWAIKINNYNKYRHLTEKEDEIFSKLILDYYSNKETIDLVKKSLLLDMRFAEEESMTKEEYLRINKVCGYDFYQTVIRKFKETTGEQLVRGTYHELFGDKEEDFGSGNA